MRVGGARRARGVGPPGSACVRRLADARAPPAAVAGIARQPRKVTKAMTKKQINRRSTLKTFVKRVNYAHMMPTRYSSDLDLKRLIDETQLDNPAKRKEMRLGVKKVFEERCVASAGEPTVLHAPLLTAPLPCPRSYRNQTEAKSEKAFTGNAFLFKRLRF